MSGVVFIFQENVIMKSHKMMGGEISMHYITACLKIISDKDLNEIMKEFKKLEEKRTKKRVVLHSMLIRLSHQNVK